MRLPSIKTIENSIADCKEDAKEIRKVMENYSHRPRKMLTKVNEIVGAHGVEYLEPANPSQYEDTGLYYVNMGDTYISTLCYDAKTGRTFISCWGDIVEKNPRRFR